MAAMNPDDVIALCDSHIDEGDVEDIGPYLLIKGLAEYIKEQ